jgi:SAM-dependent methyltransferase
MMAQESFDQLVQEALTHDFQGWDFSWTHGRWHETEPSWDYRRLVEEKIPAANAMVDMGTGGGEFLASLSSRPALTYATESYPPNIPIARDRLQPLGVYVATFENDRALPLPDQKFELVINRHESYDVLELRRILKQGGLFLTQQVGALDCIQLNKFLGAPSDLMIEEWTLEDEIRPLEEAGFHILRGEEEFLDSIFADIGVVVFYLKVIEWQIPDFSLQKYRDRLLAMHEHIRSHGSFRAQAHRFLIEAEKR